MKKGLARYKTEEKQLGWRWPIRKMVTRQAGKQGLNILGCWMGWGGRSDDEM